MPKMDTIIGMVLTAVVFNANSSIWVLLTLRRLEMWLYSQGLVFPTYMSLSNLSHCVVWITVGPQTRDVIE
jgi:hypothetical protein